MEGWNEEETTTERHGDWAYHLNQFAASAGDRFVVQTHAPESSVLPSTVTLELRSTFFLSKNKTDYFYRRPNP
ncbi:MAG: hypothetical protein BRD55_08105 [Bacteroidetes bacterium SW_9_63_38]|nr:MAG: hypothetical protein BRD55_08105 [Bacteroidetes bacterium SW_9_63_38]